MASIQSLLVELMISEWWSERTHLVDVSIVHIFSLRQPQTPTRRSHVILVNVALKPHNGVFPLERPLQYLTFTSVS